MPSRPTAVAVPPLPVRIASASALRGYNTMRWWRTPRASDRIVPLAEYFHQLDAIAGWNRLYGPHGFVQYHFLVPPGQAALMRLVVERLRRAGCAPLLAVLKRHGPGDAAPLSFVSDGWSLALDMPADCPALTETLLALDELVAAAGGRVYLAKDAAMRPGTLPAMYPRLAEWRAERDRLDPLARFGSDLGRRLGLSD
jgi:decaprenylphospho-beta-D-ribofuranose 2-oxidase